MAGSQALAQEAYDGFDYPNPGSLNGGAGGTGWAQGSSWQSSLFVASSGLSAEGDPGSGRAVFFDTQSTASDAIRALPIPLNGTYGRDNTSMWISFLVRMNNGNGCGRFAGVIVGVNPDVSYWFGISNFPLTACNSVSRAAVSRSFLGIGIPAGWNPTTGGPDILVGQIYRITAQIQFVPGPDTISIYALRGSERGLGPLVAQRNDVDVQTFRNIRIYGGGGTSTWTSFDELRIGTTPAQVVPNLCDAIDFNRDGLSPDSLDLEDFLAVLAGGPSACSTFPTPGCGDIDFNNDGFSPDSLDLDAFLSRLSGGPCV